MVGLIPLIIALLLADYLAGGPAPPLWTCVSLVAGSLLAWLLSLWLALRLLRRLRGIRHLLLAEQLAVMVPLLLHAWWCYELGLSRLIDSSLLSLLPLVAGMLGSWWLIVDSRHGSQQATGNVLNRSRFGVLPLLVMIGCFDLLRLAAKHSGLEKWWLEEAPEGVALIGSFAGSLLVLAMIPWLITRAWRTVPLAEHPAAEVIRSGCRRFGVTVRCQIWPSSTHRFYNAAVIGYLPGARYLLFSADLLATLSTDQIRAVLGHELGHIRHGHIWLYLLFMLTSFTATKLAVGPLTEVLQPWLSGYDSAAISLAVMLLLLLLCLRYGFGLVSRACERQADLAGVELAGDVAAMQTALRCVADLSGQALTAPSWMHGSIASRIAFLERTRTDPALVDEHHRGIMQLRYLIVFVLALLLILTVVNNPYRQTTDAYFDAEPLRREAVDAALAGDPGPLHSYLVARETERRRFAQMLLIQQEREKMPIGEMYRRRALLIPFATIQTGVTALDVAMDNLIGYTLVAGTDTPTAADLQIAGNLAKRLEEAARKQKDFAMLDTVACIRFRQGRQAEAAELFGLALLELDKALPDVDEKAKEQLTGFRHLLIRRLAASEEAGAPLPLEPGAIITNGAEVEKQNGLEL